MEVLQVASVGETPEAVLAGVRTLPVSTLCLLVPPDLGAQADEIRSLLDPLRVVTRVSRIDGEPIDGVMRAISALAAEAAGNGAMVQVNASSGLRHMAAAATAAAYLHGISAFVVVEERAILLPVLRFPYHALVSPPKRALLRALADSGGSARSLRELAATAGVEKSLLSYHVRGGSDGRGLEELGLVEIEKGARGRLGVRLTPMGEVFAAAPPPLAAATQTQGRTSPPTVGPDLGRV